MPFLECGHRSVKYEIIGLGPPLLFVHEWNSSLETFKRTCVPYFENDFTIILFDLPGFGASESLEWVDMETIAIIIDKVLDVAGFKSVTLMGFCMGAVLALDYAIRNPERVNALILIDILLFFPAPFRIMLTPFLGRAALRFFTKTKLGTTAFGIVFAGRKNPFRNMLRTMTQYVKTDVSRGYLEMLARYESKHHLARAACLSMPILLLVSSGSPSQFQASAKKLASRVNNSCMEFIPTKRHYGFLAAPMVIASPIKSFLGRNKIL